MRPRRTLRQVLHVLTAVVCAGALVLTSSADPSGAQDAEPTTSYIVVLRPGVDSRQVAAEHARRGARVEHEYVDAFPGYAAELTAATLREVRADPRVRFVAEDTPLLLAAQTLPTGVDRVDGEASSTRSGDGTGAVGVNVAVIDIGVERHADLAVAMGKNCAAAGTPLNPWHGTAVAGTLAAKDDGEGVVGVAPGARIWDVRVTDFYTATPMSDVICAVDWVTSTRKDKSKTNDIAVANMSLGGAGVDDGQCGRTNADPLHLAICNSSTSGVTYVVAAANASQDISQWVPAAYDEVLTVTAMADSDGKAWQPAPMAACDERAETDEAYASFSNFASSAADRAHTVASPGVCITSTAVGGTYGVFSGTSMATPHAAGLVALCIARRKCTGSPSQVIQKVVTDAASYNAAVPLYGFWGDPRPDREYPGRYYGHLIRAGSY